MLDKRTAPTRHLLAVALALAMALAPAACAKPETTGTGTAVEKDSKSKQVVKSGQAAGKSCTLDRFGGKPFDLASAKVGFSQSEKEANPFRIAETKSIRDEAKRLGIDGLRVTNGQSQFSKQIADVQQLIAQGVDLLVIAPLNSDGWEPVLQQAASKKIPIITVDRRINAKACKDYVTFIGSDFYEQGKRAADQMIKALGGKGKVAILLGAPGNNVTTERTKGFKDRMKSKAPDVDIAFEQTGQFAREQGQTVTEQLILSEPDIDGIYAENDEMALGAVTALKGAGKKPGEVHIVSIDGTRSAVEAITTGWLYAVVESNPRFGPLAFETAQKFVDGKPIPEKVIISDREYTKANAADSVGDAY